MKRIASQKNKSTAANTALILLFIAVIICGMIIQSGQALERTALNHKFYLELAGDPDLQEYIRDSLWQGLTGQETPPDPESAVYRAFRSAFDEAWFEKQLGRAAEDVLNFIDGTSQQLNVTVDISEQKELFGRELLSLAGQQDNPRLAGLLEGFLCREVIPDSYEVISIDSPADLDPKISQSLVAFRRIRSWFPYVSYAAYGLLFILALFLGGLPPGLKWYGGGFLASGITFALFTVFLNKAPFIQALAQKNEVIDKLVGANPELLSQVIALAQGTLMRGALIQMVIGFVVIGVGIGAGLLIKRKDGCFQPK